MHQQQITIFYFYVKCDLIFHNPKYPMLIKILLKKPEHKTMKKVQDEQHSDDSSGSSVEKKNTHKKTKLLHVPTCQVSGHKIKPKSKQITINLSMTRYEIIADVAEQLGWNVQYNNRRGDWDILWTDHMIEADTLMRMHFFQKISHFPGIGMLARKNLLGKGLTIMANKFPDAYNFFPKTWLLPNDYPEFRQAVYKDKEIVSSTKIKTIQNNQKVKTEINEEEEADNQSEKSVQSCDEKEENLQQQPGDNPNQIQVKKSEEEQEKNANITQKYNRCFIVKPEADCQGKGIFMTFDTQQVENGRHYVVQEYVERPYLVEGLKFDFRIYVLICGTNPLRLYCYEEGLARLATEKYQPPNKNNLKNFYMHLTNYAVNKKNPKYVYNSSAQNMETGHKRSMTSVLRYIQRRGHDISKLKAKIHDVLVKTLILGEPLISHQYKFAQPEDEDRNMCFHILGIDVMLAYRQQEDSLNPENKQKEVQIQPIVLQVNHTPSFTTDTPLDHHIKSNLIRDTLILLNVNEKTKNSLVKKTNSQKKQKKVIATNAKNLLLLESEQNKEKVRLAQLRRDEYQQGPNLGGYVKIYPCADPQKMEEYQQYMKYSGEKVCFNENNVIRGQIQQIRKEKEKDMEKKKQIGRLRKDSINNWCAEIPVNKREVATEAHRQVQEEPNNSSFPDPPSPAVLLHRSQRNIINEKRRRKFSTHGLAVENQHDQQCCSLSNEEDERKGANKTLFVQKQLEAQSCSSSNQPEQTYGGIRQMLNVQRINSYHQSQIPKKQRNNPRSFVGNSLKNSAHPNPSQNRNNKSEAESNKNNNRNNRNIISRQDGNSHQDGKSHQDGNSRQGGNNYSLLSIVNQEIKNIIRSNKIMKNTINSILNHKNRTVLPNQKKTGEKGEKSMEGSQIISPTLSIVQQHKVVHNLPIIEPLVVARSATIQVNKKKLYHLKKQNSNQVRMSGTESVQDNRKAPSQVVEQEHMKRGMVLVASKIEREERDYIGQFEDNWVRRRNHHK